MGAHRIFLFLIAAAALAGLVGWGLGGDAGGVGSQAVRRADESVGQVPAPLLEGRGHEPREAGGAAGAARSASGEDADASSHAGGPAPTPPEDVQGIVLDERGRPLEGVRIEYELLPEPSIPEDGAPIPIAPPEQATTTTDVEGRFRLPARIALLPVLRLVAQEAYWVEPTYPVVPDGDELRIVLRDAVVVEGRALRADDRPAADVPIQAEWFDASGAKRQLDGEPHSGSDGTYRLRFPPVDATVVIWALIGDVDERGRRVEFLASDTLHLGDRREAILRWERGEDVEVEVVDLSGNPVVDGHVTLIPDDQARRVPRTQELDGETNRIAFRGLAPGAYWLQFVSKSVSGALYPTMHVVAPARDVLLAPRRRETLGLRVVGLRASALQVRWWGRASGSEWYSLAASTQTDAEGRAHIDVALQGSTYLHVFDPNDDRQAVLFDVALPQDGLEVRLAPGAAICGRFRDAEGRHRRPLGVGAARDGFLVWSDLAPNGTFAVRGLPPGTYYLYWYDGERTGNFEELGLFETGRDDVVLDYPEAR